MAKNPEPTFKLTRFQAFRHLYGIETLLTIGIILSYIIPTVCIISGTSVIWFEGLLLGLLGPFVILIISGLAFTITVNIQKMISNIDYFRNTGKRHFSNADWL